MANSIDLRGECLQETILGLINVAASHGWDKFDPSSVKVIDLVYFAENLKKVDDTAEFFPHSKWPTIQHLERIARSALGE